MNLFKPASPGTTTTPAKMKPTLLPGLHVQTIVSLMAIGFPGATLAYTTLVDLDFDEATPGQEPPYSGAIGSNARPNTQIYARNFGTQIVTPAGTPFPSQALQLLPTSTIGSNFNYSQISLLNSAHRRGSSDTFLLNLDFMVSGFRLRRPDLSRSVDGFSILFDLPSSRRLDFTTDGTTGQISYNPTPVYVGTFDFDRINSLGILIDTLNNEWSAQLNGTPLFQNEPFLNSGQIQELRDVRIHFTDDATLPETPRAFIDNVVLIESPANIPEPSSMLLLAIPVGMTILRRKRSQAGMPMIPGK